MSRYTTKQSVYEYIVEHITEKGYPPTVREIAEEVDRSIATIHTHLKTLKSMGLIDGEFEKARAIRVTGYEFVKKVGVK